jgi:hypothetical protein
VGRNESKVLLLESSVGGDGSNEASFVQGVFKLQAQDTLSVFTNRQWVGSSEKVGFTYFGAFEI